MEVPASRGVEMRHFKSIVLGMVEGNRDEDEMLKRWSRDCVRRLVQQGLIWAVNQA